MSTSISFVASRRGWIWDVTALVMVGMLLYTFQKPLNAAPPQGSANGPLRSILKRGGEQDSVVSKPRPEVVASRVSALPDRELESLLAESGFDRPTILAHDASQTIYKAMVGGRLAVVVNRRQRDTLHLFAIVAEHRMNRLEKLSRANTWNLSERWGRALVDNEDDWILRHDLDLAGGAAPYTVALLLKRFAIELGEFSDVVTGDPGPAGFELNATDARPNATDTRPNATDALPVSAPEPAVASTTTAKAPLPAPATFSLKNLQAVRKAAQKVREVDADTVERIPEGWSRSPFDPMRVLAVFRSLRAKDGIVLRAYQYREDGNGNGVVWAMPVGARFPEPNTLLGDRLELFKAPKPGKALDNFMEGIAGDRSAWSFIEASLLNRELKEFGALWHGMDWDFHTIIAEDPWIARPAQQPSWAFMPPNTQERWKWHIARPQDWRPTLAVNDNVVTVTFYTFSPLYDETLFRHVDEYRPGEYRFTTETTKVATGPGGVAP